MLKHLPRNLFAFLPIWLLLYAPITSALAQANDASCPNTEEVFGFRIANYPIEHQGNVIADID